jgi:xanthine dehydrogenase YagR molybdenum-binding subunit
MAKVSVKVGFEGDTKTISVDVPDGEPAPYSVDDIAKLRLIGAPTPRQEGPEKVTGRAKYPSDIRLPGMVYAKIMRNPNAASRVESIDFSAALKVPGVVDARRVDIGSVYAGQCMAVVTAETPETCDAAIALVRVKFQYITPFVVKLEDAEKPDAPEVYAGRKNAEMSDYQGGDKADVIAAADYQVEATYTTEVQTHSSHESHGMVAHWESDDKLTVYCSTQATFGIRGQMAQRHRLPASNVRCLTPHMGGGFGSKLGGGFEGLLASQIAKDLKRPVWLFLDRHSEHVDGGNRPSSRQIMKAGINKDGAIKALAVKLTGSGGHGGANCTNPAIYAFGRNNVGRAQGSIFMNSGASAAFRAPGRPQGSFAIESFMDELAWKVKADPVEFRIRYTNEKIYHHQLTVGAEAFGWKKARNKEPGAGKGPFLRGAGCALTSWGSIGGPRASATCIIRADGSVEVQNGAQDIGTGTRTIMAVVAAEELGLTVAQIKASIGNTDWPAGPGSGGSTTAATLMPAVRTAAFKAKNELVDLAAKTWGVEAADVKWDGSTLKSGGKSLQWKEACRLIQGDAIVETAKRLDNFDTYRSGVAGAQFAEVEVDIETGVVRVLRVLAVQDCGTVINRLTAESQIIGGVFQGVSYALFENRVMCRNTGRQVNPNHDAYKILGSVDAPRVDVITMSVANGGNNIGLAGLGEAPSTPTAGAVANAIFNACGARVRSLPMTPDKVLLALDEWEKLKK